MASIYRQRHLLPDEHIGTINERGEVYRDQFGRDNYLGHVNYDDGSVHQHVTGPDIYLGKVNPDGGIMRNVQFGQDEYLGKVNDDGGIMRNIPSRPDEYVGKVTEMRHKVEGAAAMFFFFMPQAPQEDKTEQ